MANMSYCRFENTLSDLRDCKEALDNGEELSSREAKEAKALLDLCREMAEYDDDYIDSLKEDEEE